MRLKYQILWVENDSDWAESIEDDLKEIVEGEYGLVLNWDLYSKQDDKIQYNNYDLILMDLNLETEPSGDLLIKNIRDKEIYTDVVFYSADGLQKIKQKAQALDLEGVYFAGRDKDLFINKIKAVIQTTIRKVQDLNNLRGLVMAETSELDKKMENICLCYFVQNKSDKSDVIFEEILVGLETDYLNNLKKSNNCDKKCTHNIRNKPSFGEIITNFAFDSARKARSIKKIVEETNFPLQPHGLNNDFYEAYLNDIIGTRNLLAHSHSIISETGQEVLVSKKDGNEIIFDETKIKEIRQRILLYESVLDGLYESLATKID